MNPGIENTLVGIPTSFNVYDKGTRISNNRIKGLLQANTQLHGFFFVSMRCANEIQLGNKNLYPAVFFYQALYIVYVK